MTFLGTINRGYWLIHLDTEGGKHELGPFSSEAEAKDYVDNYLINIQHKLVFRGGVNYDRVF